MNIKRVKYIMSEKESYKIGYMIGEYDGQNKTLLDENFNYVPKITEGDKEFTVYDSRNDWENQLNITIPI